MAYPASTVTLDKTMDEIDSILLDLKTVSSQASATMASGNVLAGLIIGTRQRLLSTKSRLNVLKTTPGLAAYAQSQKGSPGLDVAAEFIVVLAAIDAVVDNITATFPRDVNGYLLRETWPDNGGTRTVERQFTPAQTATLRAKLADLIATIA